MGKYAYHPPMSDTHSYESSEVLLAIGDAARALGVTVGTVRRWESEGKISAQRTVGGQRRFARSEVERVMAEASS